MTKQTLKEKYPDPYREITRLRAGLKRLADVRSFGVDSTWLWNNFEAHARLQFTEDLLDGMSIARQGIWKPHTPEKSQPGQRFLSQGRTR